MKPIAGRRIPLILFVLLLVLFAAAFAGCAQTRERDLNEAPAVRGNEQEIGAPDGGLVQEGGGEDSEYLSGGAGAPVDDKAGTREEGADGDTVPIGSTKEFKQKFGGTISQMAKELGVDADLLAAVILVESGGSGFTDGRLKIRFENHYFLDRTKGYEDLFTYYWKDHKFRTSVTAEWKTVHTGRQSGEYAAFEFALSLDEEAAYRSVSMGLGQIMGANYAACGYGSAKEMFEDFSKGHERQIRGMALFFKNYNNGKTLAALQNGDLKSFVTQYNGAGQVDTYTSLILARQDEYKNLQV